MTVRRRPKGPPKPLPNPKSMPPPSAVELAEVPSRANVEAFVLMRRMIFGGRTMEEMRLVFADQFGMTGDQVKNLKRRVREHTAELALSITKTGRADQIVELRAMIDRETTRRENEIARERAARADPKNPKPFKPSAFTPSVGDIRALHELAAKIEGNVAPTKTLALNANVSQDVLELLGVQSPEEVAEFLREGAIDTTAEPVDE